MKAEGETRKKLLESGKKEFMEKGFAGASLRKICSAAGVTTGALYFFFDSKDDLFHAIVEDALQGLHALLDEHYQEDIKILAEPDGFQKHLDGEDKYHQSFVCQLVHHMYSNYDVFILLLKKAQGSAYENYVDEIVNMTKGTYRVLAEKMSQTSEGDQVDDYMCRWFTHITVDAFLYILEHEPNEQTALQNMEKIMAYIIQGWQQFVFDQQK